MFVKALLHETKVFFAGLCDSEPASGLYAPPAYELSEFNLNIFCSI